MQKHYSHDMDLSVNEENLQKILDKLSEDEV